VKSDQIKMRNAHPPLMGEWIDTIVLFNSIPQHGEIQLPRGGGRRSILDGYPEN